VQINLNTNVTSRLTGATGSPDSEAILSIDEPFPGSGNQIPFPSNATPVGGAALYQQGCVANGQSSCLNIRSVGYGFGAAGSYNGTPGHANIFQGIVNPGNTYQINWQGVPIDAPGTTITRIIRITNVRANACALVGTSSSLIPTVITELIGVSGSETIIINNPLQTVALAEQGLFGSVNAGFGPSAYQQCNSLNLSLLNQLGGVSAGPVIFSATEGFAASFKTVSYFGLVGTTYDIGQNVLGVSYFTESGWIPYNVPNLDQGGRTIGLADTSTEISFVLAGVPAGINDLFVPNSIRLVDPTGAATSGFADLTSTITNTYDYNPGPGSGTTDISPVGGTAVITYEIFAPDPNVVETLNVPVTVAFVTTSATSPAASTTPSTVAINFAPPSSVPTATSGPIPRFCQNYKPQPAFLVTACTCNLLFPFVTNQAGFDTGIAIANTTQDVYGTVGQVGTLTLTYFGNTAGNGAAPPAYTTQAGVPAGSELVFTLSSGGGDAAAPTIQVPATPTFQGYVIAQANFQYCHGFAEITDQGAQRLGSGYLALSLDVPVVSVNVRLPTGLNRTGNGGENEGH
jgi:hypothetical protein